MKKILKILKGKIDSIRFLIIFYRAQYYIIGYPKTGNTWVKYFLAVYISKYYQVPFDMDFDKKSYMYIGYNTVALNY